MHIGIDIGGTNTKGGIIAIQENKPVVEKEFSLQTPKELDKLIDKLEKEIMNLQENDTVESIGISIPGVASDEGIVTWAPNTSMLLDWNASGWARKFSSNIAVENDANCMALAEHAYGSGKGKSNIIALAIGTDIGVGMILNNTLYRGAHGFAGETSHSPFTSSDTGSKSSWGKILLEDYKSGGKNQEKILAHGISWIAHTLNPEIIILGGGAVTTEHIETDAVSRFTKELLISQINTELKILKASLGYNAQIIGASLLATQNPG